MGPDGRLAAGHERLERSCAQGWLARIGAGDVLRRGRARWLTRAGSSAVRRAVPGWSRRGRAPVRFGDRVKQSLFGTLEADPDGAARRGRSWTCSRAAVRRASRRSAGAHRRRCSWSAMRERPG